MIKINKPKRPPQKLLTSGRSQTRALCSEYDQNSQLYKNKSLVVNANYYNHKSVKKLLKKVQHNKCCFCEKDQTDEYGAVEHFRPKKAFKRSENKQNEYPGYYWLINEWRNLYFVCSPCNTSKGAIFPLANEKKRARNHHDDITLESPLIIEPTIDDPRDHIRFSKEEPKWRTRKGKRTIEVCSLDRDDLTDKRREVIRKLETWKLMISEFSHKLPPALLQKANKYLHDAVKPNAPFSSMATDFINE